jgi:diadenosine tetraphosphate (Ap4A) HIT family hydrolase
MTLVHKRVQDCRDGVNPKVICRVKSGWVVLGDVQFLPGYTLLLPDPVVYDLNALGTESRSEYLLDMTRIGDALLEVTDSNRINYEILGNTETALHAHIFPRYDHEDKELKTGPAWFYDWKKAPAFDLDRDTPLMTNIADYLIFQGGVISKNA